MVVLKNCFLTKTQIGLGLVFSSSNSNSLIIELKSHFLTKKDP